MAVNRSKQCGNTFYGYNVEDVIRIGEPGPRGKPSTVPGPPGKKGDQGDQGPAGPDPGLTTVVAGTTIHGRRVIRLADAGLAYHPDIMDNTHVLQVLGISIEAASTGNSFPVRTSGPMSDVSWNWSPGYVYCDDQGVLTQSVPASGWLQRVARVINPNTLNIDIDSPFIRS